MNVLAPIAKKTFSLEHEDQVAPAFSNAIRLAGIHPQGVTAIDLPLDIMSSGKSSDGLCSKLIPTTTVWTSSS